MLFPETRLTFIRRLARDGSEADWRQFIGEYWRPVRRFAISRGRLQAADADDVASATFEVLIRKRLLLQWTEERSARLRTLLCGIVRRQLANRFRKHQDQQLPMMGSGTDDPFVDLPDDERNVFEEFCFEEILLRSVDRMRNQCLKTGKINRFRVLFGRVCEGMTHSQIAACLNQPLSTVESWYKQARDQLAEVLRIQIRAIVSQHARPEHLASEFDEEWQRLAEFLQKMVGLNRNFSKTGWSIYRHPMSSPILTT